MEYIPIWNITKGGITMQLTQEYHVVLKSFRKQAKMTQEEIADELNVTQSCISKWESGEKPIYFDTFITWVKITNSDIHYLLEDLFHGSSSTKRRNH